MSRNQIDRHARIGIVGAGAAGLSLADCLRRAGYGRVMLLEREPRVGGKCLTLQYQGRSYDLGAIVVLNNYWKVRRLARRAGAKLRWAPRRHVCSDSKISSDQLAELPASRARLAWALLRYGRELTLERPSWGHGYAGTSLAATQPFAQWLQSKQLGVLEAIGCYVALTGTGFIQELPAAYVMKAFNLWRLLDSVLEGLGLHLPSRYLDCGYQSLMECLARGLDVRLQVQIEQIERGRTVQVRTSEGSLEFDYLVLTSPLDEALRFIDASPQEERLFRKIRYYDFWSLAAAVAGLPRDVLLFPENCMPGRRGYPVYMIAPWPDRDLLLSYAYHDPLGGPNHAVTRFTDQIERLGGEVLRLEAVRSWRYGPHAGPDDFAAGFYEELEGMQGQRRTFYAGELLSFPGVEYVLGYSQALVNRHFGPVR